MRHLKKVLSIIHFFLSLVIFLILKFFNVKLLNIATNSIGHQCIDLECYSEEIKKFKFNFRGLLLAHENYLANFHFFKYYQIEKLGNTILLNNKFLCFIIKQFKAYEYLIYDCKKYTTRISKKAMSYEILEENLFNYQIKENTEKLAIKTLNKLKISIKKKFVLLHVRDQSYRPDDNERYRDSNIKNYKKMVNYLIDQNFMIFRIGNYGMTKSDLNIVDITTLKMTKEEKEAIDIYLIYNCTFFIGSCSGLYCLASLFGKPVITFDIAPMSFTFPHGKFGLGVPKKYYSIKEDKLITFSEIFKNKFSDFRNDFQFEKNNIKTIDNTEDEIKDAVEEFLLLLKSKKSTAKINNNELQNKFYSLMDGNSYSINERTTISKTFLDRNKLLL